MSKKRRRGERICTNMAAEDRHHLCYMGKNWKQGYCKVLRDHWYMIIKIPKHTLHPYIHSNLKNVPAPKGVCAKSALLELDNLEKHNAISPNDGIEKRLKILVALFECSDQPTADAFKKQLEVVRKFYRGPL